MSSLVPISHSVTPQPLLIPEMREIAPQEQLRRKRKDMSSLAPTVRLVMSQAFLDPEARKIAPQEPFKRKKIKMSSLASTSCPIIPQPPLNPKAHWITPEEQLKRLALPIAKEVSRVVPLLILDLGKLVAEYAGLDESFTNWYKAYNLLELLPDKVPPLPDNIYQIMYSTCPIYKNKVKDDGEPYRVKDTHFLSLIPEELGSLNRMQKEVLIPYLQRTYSNSKEENPLQCAGFWDTACQPHANTPFSATHFLLMTRDVLPESRNKTWKDQVALVDDLSQKALVNYDILTLQQSFTAIITYMVATGERLYRSKDVDMQTYAPFTHVREIINGHRLMIGGYTFCGLSVTHGFGKPSKDTGIAAFRKL